MEWSSCQTVLMKTLPRLDKMDDGTPWCWTYKQVTLATVNRCFSRLKWWYWPSQPMTTKITLNPLNFGRPLMKSSHTRLGMGGRYKRPNGARELNSINKGKSSCC